MRNFRTQISFLDDPSLTEQSHKDTCDIHTIMKKYKKSGVLDHVNEYQGQYMDMTNAPDFTEAQTIIAATKTMFESVPADIRKDMDNDPAKFLEFIQNPENKTAIEAYGLDSSHLPQPSNSTQDVHTHPETDKNPPASSGEAET